jgi:LysR family transcriptional regulator, glycine cleavage system transcriptional activator
MYQLPPLNPLRAFEAAGRLKSIRKAAEELFVTPGAVSRQVQMLEDHLGTKLFRRDPRAIVLTAAGEQYFSEITQHIEGIHNATLKLTGSRGRDILKIRSYTTFSMKWLIPRLSDFQSANPTAEVRLTTSLEAVDFEHEDVDGAIRLGDGSWPGYEVDRLVRNELSPVCSPAYREQMNLRTSLDVKRLPLLHSLARPDDWMLWLKAAGIEGIDPYAGPKYTSSVLVHQAALEGQGVALAQRVLVSDDLSSGRLVEPFGPVLDRGDYTYYLIFPRNRARNPAFRKFRAWLIERAHADEDGLPEATPPTK